MKPKKRNPHTELVRAVEKLLILKPGVFAWVNNTGAGLMDGRRYVTFGYKGSADLIGLTADGKFLAIECKTGEARQTFDQRQFQEKIEGLGGRYYIIRTLDEAIRLFAAS